MRKHAVNIWTGVSATVHALSVNDAKYFAWNAVTSMLIPFGPGHDASRLLINTANTRHPTIVTIDNENKELLQGLSCKARTDLTAYKDLVDADFWFFARWATEKDYTI